MDKYTKFYENADRDNIYSSGVELDNDRFTNILLLIKKKYCNNNAKVLEIGAGNGRFQDIFDDYTAVDITENSKKYFHKPYIVIKDKEPYPFENDTFDLIFTNAVFEHIPDIDTALKEMKRVLKVGG